MADLVLPLKGEYFNAIKDGSKPEEYREANAYWTRRLIDKAGNPKTFDDVVLTLGYPGRDDDSRRLRRPWRGFVRKTITHPHFGGFPVEVFAIDVTGMDETDRKIVAWLLKMQKRKLIDDSGHGLMLTREVAEAHGLNKAEARTRLDRLADAGYIRRDQYPGSLVWRTLNPLPWETGGEWPTGAVL